MPFNILDFLESLLQLNTAEYMREVWAGSMEPWLSEAIIDLVQILVICTFLLVITLGLIWILRKVVARIQDRVGPNRVAVALTDGGELLAGAQVSAQLYRLADDPEVQRWWDVCKPCFEDVEELPPGEVWVPMEQVFFQE